MGDQEWERSAIPGCRIVTEMWVAFQKDRMVLTFAGRKERALRALGAAGGVPRM